MFQYKLLEVLDSNTLSKINDIFGSENIINLTDRIIGLSYDFRLNTYTDVLKNIVGLNVRQWTLTSSRFIDIINFSINNKLDINSINFVEFVSEVTDQNVKLNITKINMASTENEKSKFMNQLVNDLNWIMFDQCTDIKSISLSSTVIYPPFVVEMCFFNNGVLYIDDKNILNQIKKLFTIYFKQGE